MIELQNMAKGRFAYERYNEKDFYRLLSRLIKIFPQAKKELTEVGYCFGRKHWDKIITIKQQQVFIKYLG